MKKENKINSFGRITGFVVVILTVVAFAANIASAKDKKYGVFVGINDYPGTEYDLSGAVADAKNLHKLMTTRFNFATADTTLLLDKNATRSNIISKIKAYGNMASTGDLLVFTYSGHGSLFPDAYSDQLDENEEIEVNLDLGNGERYVVEPGYYDSTLVPYDADSKSSGKNWGNMILDDELYELFSGITKKGVTVVFISDSCHSGSVNKGEKKEEKKPVKFRFMKPETALKVKNLEDFNPGVPKDQVKVAERNIQGNYLALTAASDNEVAMDGGGNVVGGLFTTTLIQEINKGKTPFTYNSLMKSVIPKVAQTSLKRFGNNQHPRLDNRFGKSDGSIFEVQKTK